MCSPPDRALGCYDSMAETCLETVSQAGEMAHWVKEIATKPGDLSSIPETHVVKVEKFSSIFYIHTYRYAVFIHTYTQ